MNRVYACIDLKSFYASVECVERSLDPLTTNLVVADASRTEKTICLAVSPSLKSYGLSGRSRLYEVIQKIKEENNLRLRKINRRKFNRKSYNSEELKKNKYLAIDYLVVPPRMAYYINYSTKIYDIYLKYISEEDIHVYSIDEVFMDITNYLKYYQMTSEQLITKIMKDVYDETGITATSGIGTNLYLAKIAMDIDAKHMEPNNFGARISYLDEKIYRKKLWSHQPLTDFWRVGKGYYNKLKQNKLLTMGDIAKCSIDNEDLLFKLFGINAELLIDHAWGYEPCTIKDIKAYKPITNCLTSGQVLHEPYDYKKTIIVLREMIEELCYCLVSKGLITNQIVLTVGYDISNINSNYEGEITTDFYGRKIPKHAHGTVNLVKKTSSNQIITKEVINLYEKIVNKNLLIRRMNICANKLTSSNKKEIAYKQFSLFENNDNWEQEIEIKNKEEQQDNKLQETVLNIKNKYGKNSVVKALDLSEGATAIDRNKQIGGHKA